TFTLTFTADWTKNASGASMLVTWGESENWGFSFGIDAQGQWTVVQGGYNKSVTLHTSGVAAVDVGAQTYTIVGRTEGFTTVTDGGYTRPMGAYHISAFEGESLVFSATYGSNADDDMINFGQGYNPEIAFGGGMQGADATVMTVTAATLNPASFVPEPATATLSLLALVGLAARRRRK
ncbi:MAG: PEP-CTERM sorting domain-containing protein, partial [Akkermansia sp.]